MNMNKALQHLYKAVSGNDTSKVNISKLLVDIHYAATGVECAVKNNWAKIIDSIATNWSGGGSSDFSTAEVTVINNRAYDEFLTGSFLKNGNISPSASFSAHRTSQSNLVIPTNAMSEVWYDGTGTLAVTGNATEEDNESIYVTGDCTITIS